jgi:hypothetical protein
MHGRPREYKNQLSDPAAQPAYKKKARTEFWALLLLSIAAFEEGR